MFTPIQKMQKCMIGIMIITEKNPISFHFFLEIFFTEIILSSSFCSSAKSLRQHYCNIVFSSNK